MAGLGRNVGYGEGYRHITLSGYEGKVNGKGEGGKQRKKHRTTAHR